jgi:general stress protein YciG
MSGNTEGGKKAAITNKKRYGRNFYSNIGAKGGAASTTGGFGQGEVGRKRASIAGKIGGTASRRTSNA